MLAVKRRNCREDCSHIHARETREAERERTKHAQTGFSRHTCASAANVCSHFNQGIRGKSSGEMYSLRLTPSPAKRKPSDEGVHQNPDNLILFRSLLSSDELATVRMRGRERGKRRRNRGVILHVEQLRPTHAHARTYRHAWKEWRRERREMV